MSELAKLLTARETGKTPRNVGIAKFVSVDERASFSAFTYNVEYVVETKFSVCTVVPSNDSKALAYAIRSAKERIVQSVFNEFYEPLRELYILIARQDTREAMDALRAIQHQMFSLDE